MDLAWHWKVTLTLALACSLAGCKSPFGGQTAPSSATTTNPLTKAWKSTTSSVAGALTIKPKTTPAADPTALGSAEPKISASTHIATGRLLESRQEFPKAQIEYEKAIKVEPTNLTALVSLARLQDRQGQADQAIVTYQKALKAHPQSALVHNDLGLCYARKRDLASAISTLNKAVELEPTKPNYRNNLATVFVEAGRSDEALKHLQAVLDPAAAHYNLAYLLNHRGQTDLARRHLSQAVGIDPSLTEAQEMLAQLGGGAGSPTGVVAARQEMASPAANTTPALGAAPQGGAYGAEYPAESYPPTGELPTQSAEPVYHIGSEGIEASPASGSSIYQPTSHQYPAAPQMHSPTSYHLDDDEEGIEAEVMVVTHLVYGSDADPAPKPTSLVDDDAEEEAGTETQLPEPTSVKPVSKLPMLVPISE